MSAYGNALREADRYLRETGREHLRVTLEVIGDLEEVALYADPVAADVLRALEQEAEDHVWGL